MADFGLYSVFNEEPEQVSYEDSMREAQEATDRYGNFKDYIKAHRWPVNGEIREKLLSGISNKENIRHIETLISDHRRRLAIKEEVPVIDILRSIYGDSLRFDPNSTE